MDRKEDILMRHQMRKKAIPRRVQTESTFGTSNHKGPEKTPNRLHGYLIKMTVATALVLVSIFIQRGVFNSSPKVNNEVSQVLWTDYQFSNLSAWYSKLSNDPLALLTLPNSDKATSASNIHFAMPVSGQVVQTYTKAQNGILIRADKATAIDAVQAGVVTFSGKKSSTGNTIIIQHSNVTESIYGKVTSVSVKPYQHVKKGEKIAEIKPKKNTPYSVFYFAVKKNNHFIDPVQMIPLD